MSQLLFESIAFLTVWTGTTDQYRNDLILRPCAETAASLMSTPQPLSNKHPL